MIDEKIEKLKSILEKLRNNAKYMGNGIIKVDFFLNHLVDTQMMLLIGEMIADYFERYNPSKVLTVESSGIIPAFTTAMNLKIPVIFAKKKGAATMERPIIERVVSRTRGNTVELHVSKEFLDKKDKILIVDDFLASGKTIGTLINITKRVGAELVGIAAVMEKTFENGRKYLEKLVDVPIYSIIKISMDKNGKIDFDI